MKKVIVIGCGSVGLGTATEILAKKTNIVVETKTINDDIFTRKNEDLSKTFELAHKEDVKLKYPYKNKSKYIPNK